MSAGSDPRRTRGGGWRAEWRNFTTAARLGWQMEANWADPLLFFIYSVAKPFATTLILVVMLEVVSGGSRPDYRTFVVIGTALWSFVVGGLAGLAQSVLEDRERYRMLKYVYVSPADFTVFLLGRGTARLAIGAMGAVITLGLGILLLGVRFDPAQVDVLLLLASMVLGLVSIVALGLLLGALCLLVRQEAWSYPEAVAGALFLLVGAVFPLTVLPAPLQLVGLGLPLTWWLEGTRQALFPGVLSGLGGPGSAFAALSGRDTPAPAQIVLALLLTGLLVTLAAAICFRLSEQRAKDRGLIDMTTGS